MNRVLIFFVCIIWLLETGPVIGQEMKNGKIPVKRVSLRISSEKDRYPRKQTMLLPDSAGKYPLVMLVGNSGLLDPESAKAERVLFPALADTLCRSGFAVAWLEFQPDDGVSTFDMATEIASTLRQLNINHHIDSNYIALIGFDEGGIISALVSAQSWSPAWLILVSTPAQKGSDALISRKLCQLAAAEDKNTSASTLRKNLEDIHRILKKVSDNKAAAQKIGKYNTAINPDELKYYTSNWYRTYLQISPEEYFKSVRCPVLTIYGVNDQVTEPGLNMEALEKAFIFGGNSSYTFHEIPAMDHYVHKTITTENAKSIPAEIPAELFEVVQRWISERAKRH